MTTDARDTALRSSVHIARYAEILAHVVFFGAERTAAVVERFGYSLEAWRDVDRAWTNGIATGTDCDKPAHILAFSSTFHQHRARLAEEKPSFESITDKQLRPQVPSAQVNPGAATKSAGVPSYMLAEAARAAAPTPEGASPWAAYAVPPVESPAGISTPSTPLHAKNPNANLGTTQAIDDNDISAIARRVVPFGHSSAPTDVRPTRDPELTLEEYAALSVELELYPEQKPHILQRHGLTPSQHARIEAGWDAQLTLNPRLAAAWQQAASKCRTRLLGGT